VKIGQIVGAWGIRGQVKVEPLTEFADRFKIGTRLRLGGHWVTVEDFSVHKGRPLLKLSGVDDMNAAEALQWQYLELEDAPPVELEEDEYLSEDLIGMQVTTTAGEQLGRVDRVLPYPAHDVLQVGEILIPAVKQFVKKVDLKARRIEVELIEGMR